MICLHMHRSKQFLSEDWIDSGWYYFQWQSDYRYLWLFDVFRFSDQVEPECSSHSAQRGHPPVAHGEVRRQASDSGIRHQLQRSVSTGVLLCRRCCWQSPQEHHPQFSCYRVKLSILCVRWNPPWKTTFNNNINNVHLPCAHQHHECSYNTYQLKQYSTHMHSKVLLIQFT